LVIGALTLIAARVFGQAALTVLYGPEYAADAGVLVWLVAATVITFASVFLGTGTTARHRFWAQLLISVTSCIVVAACTVPLVRRYALYGAAWTLLLGAVVEFSAYALLVLRDRKPSSANVAGPLVGLPGGASTSMPRPGVHVLNVFGQLERGGAELRAVELAEAFPPDRVRSDFLALTGLDGVLDNRVRAAGGAVIKCRLDWTFPRRFYGLLRERRYDVVHSHVHYFSGVILFLARLAGVQGRVSHLHTARVNDREDTRRRRLQLALCRHLIRWNATDIIAAGEGAMCAAWGPAWKTDSRCHVIYNTVRSDRLQPAADRRAGRPTIVNVASLKPIKNQLRLIEIVRRLSATHPAVRLRLIGKEIDDYGIKVRDAASAAGVADRVETVGEVDDAMPALAQADLMVLPSVWEGLPCVVLESCAVGTPVLASDLPGTREIARHLGLVHLMPLEADDDAWAAAAVQIIERGRLDARAAAEDLARSPFVFDRSSRAHFEIWSRLRATA
jgi:glycosyltransferase involved in cell wall biosynthesis